MRRPHAASIGLVGALAATSVLLGACGSSDTSSPSPSATSTAPTTSVPTGVPPTSSTTPTTQPATGLPLRINFVGKVKVSARAPQGYVTNPALRTFEAAARSVDGTQLLTVTVSPTIVDPAEVPLSKVAHIANRDAFGGKGTILSPVTVDGRAYYGVSGPRMGFQATEYGTEALIGTNGVDITLDFFFKPSVPVAQRQAIVDSVLPTVEIGPA